MSQEYRPSVTKDFSAKIIAKPSINDKQWSGPCAPNFHLSLLFCSVTVGTGRPTHSYCLIPNASAYGALREDKNKYSKVMSKYLI